MILWIGVVIRARLVKKRIRGPVSARNVPLCDSGEEFRVRQVPGDGGCLFHALTVSLLYDKTKTHRLFDDEMRKK